MSHIAASATSLSALSLSTVCGAVAFYREEAVDLVTAVAIGAPSVVGARCGILIARRLSNDTNRLTFDILSTLLLPTHLVVQQMPPRDNKQASIPLHAAFGLVSGALSALMGVGGLPLTISYLTLATPLHHHVVQGTAMCSVLPAVLASAASHLAARAVPVRFPLFGRCHSRRRSASPPRPRRDPRSARTSVPPSPSASPSPTSETCTASASSSSAAAPPSQLVEVSFSAFGHPVPDLPPPGRPRDSIDGEARGDTYGWWRPTGDAGCQHWSLLAPMGGDAART